MYLKFMFELCEACELVLVCPDGYMSFQVSGVFNVTLQTCHRHVYLGLPCFWFSFVLVFCFCFSFHTGLEIYNRT